MPKPIYPFKRTSLVFGAFHRPQQVYCRMRNTSRKQFCLGSGRLSTWSTAIRKETANHLVACQYHTTMSPSPPLATVDDDINYYPVEDAEALENYVVGGFHPVQLGDVFLDGRYTIVHKLGFGGFSTVWLARDEQEKRYVSLKICCASRHQEPGELQVLNLIKSRPDGEPGKGYMHLVLNSFDIEGPNGSHQCFVSPVARISAAASKAASDGLWLFPMPVARAMTAQLISAVAYLHSLGIAHGGQWSRPHNVPTSISY